MAWNWQLPNWPIFRYDPSGISSYERTFLLGSGSSSAYLKTISDDERNRFVVEIISLEGLESSKIEGEFLERENLRSLIRYHFGLNDGLKKSSDKEDGMAELLCNVYRTYDTSLSHEMLWEWHCMLFKDSSLEECGRYRTHSEAMQIVVSGGAHGRRVHFEAPPSKNIPYEMNEFIKWYNRSSTSISILGRAALAHVYFESIHPFEDGNGRIGRILVEKALSQGVGHPTLIAVSKFIEKHKKEYYAELERCNQTLDVQHWIEFFAKIILQAQDESMRILLFLIQKSKMLTALSGKLNHRQEKALLRMFAEGPDGFAGGLSANKYIAITKTTRATATRDLVDLTTKGALKKTGGRRHTRYWLNLD